MAVRERVAPARRVRDRPTDPRPWWNTSRRPGGGSCAPGWAWTSAGRSPTSSRCRRQAADGQGPVDARRPVRGRAGRAAGGGDRGERGAFAHGTTVATNALLERRGARTALVTPRASATCSRSAARTGRTSTTYARPAAAARPARRCASRVRERIGPATASSSRSTRTSLERGRRRRCARRRSRRSRCACCSPSSHPDHERRVGRGAARARCPTSTSRSRSEVLPEFREYERFSTTVGRRVPGARGSPPT